MGILGRNWEDEPTDNEKFQEIMGYPLFPDEDLLKEIDRSIETSNLTRKQTKQLSDLRQEILERRE